MAPNSKMPGGRGRVTGGEEARRGGSITGSETRADPRLRHAPSIPPARDRVTLYGPARDESGNEISRDSANVVQEGTIREIFEAHVPDAEEREKAQDLLLSDGRVTLRIGSDDHLLVLAPQPPMRDESARSRPLDRRSAPMPSVRPAEWPRPAPPPEQVEE